VSRGLILTIFAVAAATLLSPHAAAASFNAGRIIDDAVFTNNTTMSVDAIQAFLASKVATCDTSGTQSAADWGYPKLTHAQFATQIKGWPGPPYTCLKDYSENGVGVAQLIYNLAQQYKINPQVLIVTLQKESSLVTDNWPLPSQYRTATGYGCPDSGPNNSANCSSSYYGFTNQLTWTAKMYRAVLNQSPTWYSPYIKGSNYIQYNPNAACGGTMVTIENWSTAALYDYTPYQPNAAALNAGYGLGDNCSAYGNRNFYLYFTNWFGDSTPVRTGMAASLGSGITKHSSFVTADGMRHVFGLKANGDVVASWWGMQNGKYINSTGTVANFGADVTGISSFVTADGMRHVFGLKANGDVVASWWQG